MIDIKKKCKVLKTVKDLNNANFLHCIFSFIIVNII